jgi:hypothetical protein
VGGGQSGFPVVTMQMYILSQHQPAAFHKGVHR